MGLPQVSQLLSRARQRQRDASNTIHWNHSLWACVLSYALVQIDFHIVVGARTDLCDVQVACSELQISWLLNEPRCAIATVVQGLCYTYTGRVLVSAV